MLRRFFCFQTAVFHPFGDCFRAVRGTPEASADLRGEILRDFWRDVFAIIATIGARNSAETHECIVAAESLLHLFVSTPSRVELISGFAQNYHACRATGILKTRLFEFLAKTLPQHRLWRFVLTVDRETIQYERFLTMENNCPSGWVSNFITCQESFWTSRNSWIWLPNLVSPLSDSKLQSEQDSERLIEQLQHKKSRAKSEIIAEFLASQRALFETASREIESEISRHGERRLTPSSGFLIYSQIA